MRRHKAGLTICIIFLVLDLLLAVLLIFFFTKDQMKERRGRDTLAQRIGVTDGMDESAQQELYALEVGEAFSMVNMLSEATVFDEKVTVSLSNDSNYILQATLILAQTGETLAQTGLIDPGYRLEEWELDRIPEPGSYHCLVRCEFYTVENEIYLGAAARQLLLKVE